MLGGGGGRNTLALPAGFLDSLLAEMRTQTALLRQISDQQKNMIGGLRALLQREDSLPDAAADLRTLVAWSGVDLLRALDTKSNSDHAALQGAARSIYLDGLRSLRPATRTGEGVG